MQIVYDILSALAGVTIVSGVSEDRAASWMTDSSPISLGDARVALSVTLPGDHVRCGTILVVARKADPVEAVAALNREIADQQIADRTHRYIDPSHHRIREPIETPASRLVPTGYVERPVDVLERLDHNIEDLMTDEELEAARCRA